MNPLQNDRRIIMSYVSAEDVLPKELIETTMFSLSEKSIQRIIRTTDEIDDSI